MLAPQNSRSKDVGIRAIVIAELKFRDVERHIFAAHLVECADNTALEDTPKAFNRVRVDCANHILMPTVVNAAVGNSRRQILIAGPCVCRKQTNFVGTNLINKIDGRLSRNTFQNAGNHVTLALHSANDWCFVAVMTFLFIPMPVFVFAADERFVHFDDAAQLVDILHKRCADFMAHSPCGFVRAETHVAHDLERTHSLFARKHQVSDFKPLAKRLIRVLKNRARNMRETIAGCGRALVALPRPGAIRQLVGLLCATARAADAIGPAARDQIGATGFLVREHLVKFPSGHLMDGLGSTGHRNISLTGHKRSVPWI